MNLPTDSIAEDAMSPIKGKQAEILDKIVIPAFPYS